MTVPWNLSCPEPRAVVCLLALCVFMACAASNTRAPLVVDAPAEHQDAEVYVDGNFVGLVSDLKSTEQTVQLGAGKHRVEIRKPGRFPFQRTVEVEPGQTRPLTLSAELLTDPP